jgi:hypothetical protein
MVLSGVRRLAPAQLKLPNRFATRVARIGSVVSERMRQL